MKKRGFFLFFAACDVSHSFSVFKKKDLRKHAFCELNTYFTEMRAFLRLAQTEKYGASSKY